MRWMIAVLAAMTTVTALPAHAFDERAWLYVGGGGARYGMADLNEELRAFNQTNVARGLSFGMLEQGPGFGLAMGFETTTRWNFGLGYDRLIAVTKAASPTEQVRYEFTANACRAFAEYAIRPIGSNSLRIGAGIGWVGESGKVNSASAGYPPTESPLRGTGVLYEGYVGGDFWLAPTFALSSTAGYRLAKLPSVNTNGYEYDSQIDGTAVQIDLSGPYLRIGIKLASNPGD